MSFYSPSVFEWRSNICDAKISCPQKKQHYWVYKKKHSTSDIFYNRRRKITHSCNWKPIERYLFGRGVKFRASGVAFPLLLLAN